MKKTLTCISMILILGFAACNTDKAEQGEEKAYAVNYSKEHAMSLMQSYLELKDALVQTDGPAAQLQAKAMLTVLGEGKDQLSNEIRTLANAMSLTEDVSKIREQFDPLSQLFLSLAGSAQLEGQGFNKQYCPMAFDNDGAYWFSNSDEIMNPYFGDEMLHCGRVEAEF